MYELVPNMFPKNDPHFLGYIPYMEQMGPMQNLQNLYISIHNLYMIYTYTYT
jgi:hypothetical protein